MPANKKTLVLLPGLLCDQTVWADFMNSISGRIPIVVADFSSQDCISRMAEQSLQLCSGKILLAGHSMGVRVALEMLRMAPERIQKLALLDGGICAKQQGEDSRRQKLVDIAYKNGMQALADAWLPALLHPSSRNNKRLMHQLTTKVLAKDPHIHARQIKAILNRPDAQHVLADIHC